MTYTDVTWLELFSGWIVAGVFFLTSVYWFVWMTLWKGLALKATKTIEHMDWVKASQWSAEDYGKIIQGQQVKLNAANEKALSLESQLSRFKDRKRGKSGRFEKNTGT